MLNALLCQRSRGFSVERSGDVVIATSTRPGFHCLVGSFICTLNSKGAKPPFNTPLERGVSHKIDVPKLFFLFFVICFLDAKSTRTSSISVNRNKTLQIENWKHIFSNKSCIEKKSLSNQQHWRLLVLPKRAWKEPVPREYGPSTMLGEQPHCEHQDWRENSANTSPGYHISHVKLQLSPK